MSDEEGLDFCDGCHGWIGKYGYMVDTGKVDPDYNVPVVKVYCVPCYEAGKHLGPA